MQIEIGDDNADELRFSVGKYPCNLVFPINESIKSIGNYFAVLFSYGVGSIARILNPWAFKTLDNSRSSVLK